MATSWTLQNNSSEAAETVNIKPFLRTGWAESSRESVNGAVTLESRAAGTNPTYPLVRRVVSRPAQVFHPAEGGSRKRAGRVFRVEVYSNVAVEDTVLGPMAQEVVQTAVEIKYSGNTIPDQRDVLQMLMSTLAELYNSVAAGTPDYTVIDRVAVGVTNID